jgi:hypothetical protein
LLSKRLAFFDKDPIIWTGTYELHDFYKTLLHLKASHPALRGGDPTVITHRIKTTADDHVFVFLRRNGEKEVLVILNFSQLLKIPFQITGEEVKGNFRNVFSGDIADFNVTKDLEVSDYLVFEK